MGPNGASKTTIVWPVGLASAKGTAGQYFGCKKGKKARAAIGYVHQVGLL
jgi:ABC-type Mn2+/Zn2+ transport system ATPase subunit